MFLLVPECILFLLFSMRSCDNMSSATDIFPITIIAGELSRYTISDDEDGGLQLFFLPKRNLFTLSKAYRVFWEMGNKCEKSHLSRWYWATAASYVSQQHNHKRSNQPMQHHTNTIIYKGCSENISHQLSLVYSDNFPKRFDLKRKSFSVHSR